MAELPVMPWFADAYIADTRHLSLEEHGAYRLLLDIAWRAPGNALPADDKRIAQMLGITPGKWAKLKPAVMAFWLQTPAGWVQKKLSETFANALDRKAKCRAAAHAKWGTKPLIDNEQPLPFADANADADADANADATINHEPSTLAKANGGKPPDPVKELFELGVGILTAAGVSDKQARSLIGKHRKAHSDAQVLQALLDCRAQAISAPVEWLEKRLKGARYVSASGYEYRGSLEDIRRKAEARADWGTYWQVESDLKEQKHAAQTG